MNHSCEPNVTMVDATTIAARRDIVLGEEVVADYAMWLNDPKYKMKHECRCGSPQCRKIITGNDWRLPGFVASNFGHASPFINERIAILKGERKMRALITGGSRGIGFAIARRLLADGHDVFIVSKSVSNLEQAKNELTGGAALLTFPCDVAEIDQVKGSLAYAQANGFVPNVLILNAGIFLEGTLSDGSREAFIKTLQVNLIALSTSFRCI